MSSAYAYIYQAALYCEECGEAIRERLDKAGEAPEDVDDETSYDSADYPKGPYEIGESDVPDHCEGCGAFLENDLTSEGMTYTREAIERDLLAGREDSVAVDVWMPFYDVKLSPRVVRLARATPEIRKLADAEGMFPAYTSLGSYPLFYVVGDSDLICPACANDHETGLHAFGDEKITAYGVNWEDPDMWCDCGERIPSAYAELDETSEQFTEGPSEDQTEDSGPAPVTCSQCGETYDANEVTHTCAYAEEECEPCACDNKCGEPCRNCSKGA